MNLGARMMLAKCASPLQPGLRPFIKQAGWALELPPEHTHYIGLGSIVKCGGQTFDADASGNVRIPVALLREHRALIENDHLEPERKPLPRPQQSGVTWPEFLASRGVRL